MVKVLFDFAVDSGVEFGYARVVFAVSAGFPFVNVTTVADPVTVLCDIKSVCSVVSIEKTIEAGAGVV